MICVVWNACGLGGQRAFQNLQRLISKSTPDLIFVSEPRVSKLVASNWRYLLNFSNCFCVDANSQSGNLLLFWNDNIDVSILSYSSGHVDCFISSSSLVLYRFLW